MDETVSVALLQNVLDTQQSLITIFKGEKLFIANSAFLRFFRASDVADFNKSYRSFPECFVPHPSYFNRGSLVEGEYWYESIKRFDKDNQIVSMLESGYEPHAFSLTVSETVDDCTVVTFHDVTQKLIQRIMIENNATTDAQSGAYDKQYFQYVSKSYEDAALFNKKIIGISKIVIDEQKFDDDSLKELVQKLKESIREDDMLVRWTKDTFLLVCLIDESVKIDLIVSKLRGIHPTDVRITSQTQAEGETIASLLGRVS